MKIKVTGVYVDDQDKALRFYTQVLGFAKKADFSQGPFRWLTVASPEEPDGTELQLALNDNPAAKAYQQAMFQQGQPGAMFYTDDVKGDYERIKARGAEFTMPPPTSFSSPSWHAIHARRWMPGRLRSVRFWSAHVDALERHLDHMDQSTRTKRKARRRR
ncbi:MAG: glyoxalase [Acidobacteria bacterium]|nr:MAG: glyoxalase [Acidobacteriota bacterium]